MTWLKHNLKNRLVDPSCDFKFETTINDYEKIEFQKASELVCRNLFSINKNIFLGLSGGIDSEYVFRKFHSLNIFIKPIIVTCKCYIKETDIAFSLCKELNVEPIVIPISENEMFLYFYKNIFQLFNGIGIGSVPSLVVTEYAKQNGGIFVKSEHVIGDMNDKVCVEMNEWDFYCSIQHENSYNFFMHTPEIVYSMVSKMNDKTSQSFKCDLFELPYRKKIYPTYSKHIVDAYKQVISKRTYKPNHGFFEDPQTFLKKYF